MISFSLSRLLELFREQMDFLELARARQSCRAYDPHRPVEQEKLDAVLEAARLAPSACNGQPYHITVCRGEAAQAAAYFSDERASANVAVDYTLAKFVKKQSGSAPGHVIYTDYYTAYVNPAKPKGK